MILSIDIGSTRTHVAAVDIDKMQCISRIDFDNGGFSARFPDAIRKITKAHPQIRRANISSCVKNLSIKAKAFCIDGSGMINDAVIIQAHDKLSVKFKYDDPQSLGADRVCDALACAALFKGEDCIIIDAGTAITIDCLRGGRTFEGGAILPGCAMQAKALYDGTDALPNVYLYDMNCDDNGVNTVDNQINTDIIDTANKTTGIPALSTTACIASGILYGTAGAVDRCVDECLRNGYNSTDTTRIVATGGGWDAIKSFINHKATPVPDLTLLGAGLFIPRR